MFALKLDRKTNLWHFSELEKCLENYFHLVLFLLLRHYIKQEYSFYNGFKRKELHYLFDAKHYIRKENVN